METPVVSVNKSATPPKTPSDSNRINQASAFLVSGMNRGIAPIHRISTENADKFSIFVYQILTQLMDGEEISEVNVSACNYNFSLNKTEDAITLTYMGVIGKTDYKSFDKLQAFLLANIFNHPEKYSSKAALTLALTHPLSDPDAVRNTYKFIAFNPRLFSVENYNRAALYIGEHSVNYSKDEIIKAATEFFNQNKGFFFTAIRNQLEFLATFRSREEKNQMEDYAKQLDDVLSLDKTAHPVFVAGFSNPSQFKTNSDYWKTGECIKAISNDTGIAIFILLNALHPALVHWNNQNEITDTMGKRTLSLHF